MAFLGTCHYQYVPEMAFLGTYHYQYVPEMAFWVHITYYYGVGFIHLPIQCVRRCLRFFPDS